MQTKIRSGRAQGNSSSLTRALQCQEKHFEKLPTKAPLSWIQSSSSRVSKLTVKKKALATVLLVLYLKNEISMKTITENPKITYCFKSQLFLLCALGQTAPEERAG